MKLKFTFRNIFPKLLTSLIIIIWNYNQGLGQYTQVGSKLVGNGIGSGGGSAQGYSVCISSDGTMIAEGGFGDNYGSGAVWVYTLSGGNWVQMGNKLVGTGAVGQYGTDVNQGSAIAFSGDGKTLAVGGYEDSTLVGAVWIYTLSGSNWSQKGKKIVGKKVPGANYQGNSLSLSADGTVLAVGGVDTLDIGSAIWVYTFSGSNWIPMGSKINLSDTINISNFLSLVDDFLVSLSADGMTLAIGSPGDSLGAGAVWVYYFEGGNWSQMGKKLVGSGMGFLAGQGGSVSLSADGTVLAVGGQEDNSAAGATWVYTLSGGNWTQMGNKLVGSGGTGNIAINQGCSVSLSADGRTLATGGRNDNSGLGAIWIFTLTGGNWTQVGNKLVGSGAVPGTYGSNEGNAVSLSSDGKTLAFGGYPDNGGYGAVWVFKYTGVDLTNIENEKSNLNNEIIIYPNPFSTSFRINSIQEYSYSLYDIKGNILETGSTFSSLVGNNLASGIYQLKINDKAFKVVKLP